MSAADGVAVDHGYHRFGDGAYGLVEVKHVEARHTVLVYISADPFDFLVTSRTECLVAGTGEDYHAYVGSFAAIGHASSISSLVLGRNAL